MTVTVYRELECDMELSAILCNHAEVQNNLLYLAGGGIDRAIIPQGVPGPWTISVSMGMTLIVPWTQTNQQHSLTVTLVDADEQPLKVPTGPETEEPLRVDMQFNLGRPPTLEVGEGQTVSLAVNLPALPMPKLGGYFFVIAVDGTELKRLGYRLTTLLGMTMNSGPGALPRLP
jgi:hypothetical protein